MKTGCCLLSRAATLFAAYALAGGAVWAFPAPKISNVAVAPSEGRRAKVDVTYSLSEPAIVLADVQTNVTGTASGDEYASIGPALQLTFTGDVGHKVEAGSRGFTWHAAKDWPSNRLESVRVKLTAYPTNRPPAYLVVDLAPDAAERYRYYASANAIPGYPDADVYRTQKLVMKFIRAKNIPWMMGSLAEASGTDREHPHPVRLRSDYWMGVFEVTLGQLAWFTGGSASSKTNCLPLSNYCTYDMVRGSGSLYPAEPASGSYLGQLHAHTGIWFELPSEAQWEYAAKAGHGGYTWGNGTHMSLFNLTNGVGQAVIAVSSSGGAERVGSRLPNDFGLYDMMGNVREGCLDWLQDVIVWNTNGVPNANGEYCLDGVTAGTSRVVRGGYYNSAWSSVRPACRNDGQKPNLWIEAFGFRLVTSFGLE